MSERESASSFEKDFSRKSESTQRSRNGVRKSNFRKKSKKQDRQLNSRRNRRSREPEQLTLVDNNDKRKKFLSNYLLLEQRLQEQKGKSKNRYANDGLFRTDSDLKLLPRRRDFVQYADEDEKLAFASSNSEADKSALISSFRYENTITCCKHGVPCEASRYCDDFISDRNSNSFCHYGEKRRTDNNVSDSFATNSSKSGCSEGDSVPGYENLNDLSNETSASSRKSSRDSSNQTTAMSTTGSNSSTVLSPYSNRKSCDDITLSSRDGSERSSLKQKSSFDSTESTLSSGTNSRENDSGYVFPDQFNSLRNKSGDKSPVNWSDRFSFSIYREVNPKMQDEIRYDISSPPLSLDENCKTKEFLRAQNERNLKLRKQLEALNLGRKHTYRSSDDES